MNQQISDIVQKYFFHEQRVRGAHYFGSNAVTVISADDAHIQTTVNGSKPHTVKIKRKDNAFSVSCNCAFFRKYTLCKHIWASFLASQGHGCFPSVDPKRISMKRDLKRETFKGTMKDLWNETKDDDGYEKELQQQNQAIQKQGKLNGTQKSSAPPAPTLVPQKREPPPQWMELIHTAASVSPVHHRKPSHRIFNTHRIVYILKQRTNIFDPDLEIMVRLMPDHAVDSVDELKTIAMNREDIPALPLEVDQMILSYALGTTLTRYQTYTYSSRMPTTFFLPAESQHIMQSLFSTGRFHLCTEKGSLLGPCRFESSQQWRLHITLSPDRGDSLTYSMKASLFGNGSQRDLIDLFRVSASGFVFWKDCTISRLESQRSIPLMLFFLRKSTMAVPSHQLEDFIDRFVTLDHGARMIFPPELGIRETAIAPVPVLRISKPGDDAGKQTLFCRFSFRYENREIPALFPGGNLYHKETKQLILRDTSVESGAVALLDGFGCKRYSHAVSQADQWSLFTFQAKKLPSLVGSLLENKWVVETQGALYRKPGSFSMTVTSGIDWFDLTADCDFQGKKAGLPEILRALKKGEHFVALEDGTLGMLPQEWLEKYASFAEMGEVNDGRIRFHKSQTLIVDMLLLEQPEVRCDAQFDTLRKTLHTFSGIEQPPAPANFMGTLRPYQRDGLGWLHCIQRLGLGGILADDMGLGKTVQVLALLADRYREHTHKKKKRTLPPSLIVVPRSLIFNWKQEAGRFAPRLVIKDFSTGERLVGDMRSDDHDIMLITYGTLRRDIASLKDREFDYVILDEAQAIKNADTITAKAARLLKASNRLALSGTPVENHLGELWSIFEFLNPGMLGSAGVFRAYAGAAVVEKDRLHPLHRALRPFILRRTKAQVAPDLPEKLEETLYCEMEPAQRKLYDELRDYYRGSLLGYVDEVGIGKAQIRILEALLRLRQAACHPGLIDKKRAGESSAKLETLLAQLLEILDEGHKALVFSQFTSLLSIVRTALDNEKIAYEYLDGSTRDRQQRVERFQSDPGCRIFLISLKAGGLGLNLTAAEYVFLLDPWWNPAVEAQAVDRTHRIGQNNTVFAYRLICRDTVEEKVLALQKTKRDLADSIITAENGAVRSIGIDDLSLLLS